MASIFNKNPPFCRWLPIEFLFFFIISLFLPIWIFRLISHFLSSHHQNVLSKLLFMDLSSPWYLYLPLMAIIGYLSWRLFPSFLRISDRIIHTSPFFYHFPHGIYFGLFISLIFGIIEYLPDFQNTFLFTGDFIICPIIAAVLIWIIEAELVIKQKLIALSSSESTNSLWILDERPIGPNICDDLQHYRIASEIQRIVLGNTGNNGRVIALYGRNGSGKTSILNLLEMNLAQFPGISTGRFEAYNYRSEKEITKAFFGALSGLLCKKAILPKVSGIPDRYLDLIYGFSGITSPLKLIAQSVHDFISKAYNTEDMRSIFNWYLSRQNKRVVLIVDDIDRCSIRSRHLLLQLMNTIGRINNLYFIISASQNEMLSQPDPTLVSLID